MCCPFDRIPSNFIPKTITTETGEEAEIIFHITGIIDRTPQTFGDRIVRTFQWLEWTEKIAEIVDESFHLLGSFFKKYASAQIYQGLEGIHHHAHGIEHFLHAACFLGDLSRLMTGKFFEYSDAERTQIHYLRSIARVCHAVSHLFATTAFLSEQKIIQYSAIEKIVVMKSAFCLMGYSLMAISLIWDRCHANEIGGEEIEDPFFSDLTIHVSGLVFEASPLLRESPSFAEWEWWLTKGGAFAGIVHAWFVSQRLSNHNQEEVSAHFSWHPNEKNLEVVHHACQDH